MECLILVTCHIIGFKKDRKVGRKGFTKFISKGKYTIDDDKIITGLLLVNGHMISKYLLKRRNSDGKFLDLDYENHSTDDHVKFIVKVNDEVLFDNIYKTKRFLIEDFGSKLTSTKSLSNLHLYNRDGVIHKHDVQLSNY